ncbi:hypothetical protein SCACP_10820 [Sporomusa carbonis]
MCPYHNNGCKIHQHYSGTNLCSENYCACARYMYASVRGVVSVPDNMQAIDYALLQRRE